MSHDGLFPAETQVRVRKQTVAVSVITRFLCWSE